MGMSGIVGSLLGLLFGSGRNVIAETAEVFRENAEAQATREAGMQTSALQQFGTEFTSNRSSWFDRFIDGLNRIPRPALALGTLALFVAAMVDPVWFAERMAGIALVPDPMWWLLTAIVGFYFGARHQVKGHQFRREIAASMAEVPGVVQQIRDIDAVAAPSASLPAPDRREADAGGNPALAAWQARQG
ncbi:holin family protein [Salipiger sp. 1_MG-2023]|uniref:holin family protein n=1 Tax=Salipiger sp. 1_MG-2023 TaxID=3062665 RepID=UPI0026E3AF21|nr:holin family protein [Salipiger sp. 1_MG-2023]MDO6585481.1 holin family protein [Salipiger sp. 1_MG-2023]